MGMHCSVRSGRLAYTTVGVLREAKDLLEERLSTVEEESLDIGVGWLLEPSVE